MEVEAWAGEICERKLQVEEGGRGNSWKNPRKKFMKILFTRCQTVRINLLANLFENVP